MVGTHTKRRKNIVTITIPEVRDVQVVMFFNLPKHNCNYTFPFLYQPCQTTMVWDHLPTRKSTSLQTAPLLFHPHHPPTQLIQLWVSCRQSPHRWPQVQTPVLICTRNPPIHLFLRTLLRTANVRAVVAVEAKGATPSPTPALCLLHHRRLPPKSTRPPLQSPPCFMVVPPKKNL